MPRRISTRLLTAALVSMWAAGAVPASGQQAPPAARPAAETGPAVEGFGATYAVPGTGLPLPAGADYKVAFDVSVGQTDPATVNPRIDTVARFVNMHVRAGVPLVNVKAALVLHGTAAKDALDHAGYRARHGVDNPNLPLLEALARAGVRIYVCGQSAASRGLGFDEFASPAKLALSAMTAHALLAREGYSSNPF